VWWGGKWSSCDTPIPSKWQGMLLPERWEKFLVLVATKGQHMMAKAVKMLQLDYHVLHGSRLWTGWVGAEAAAPKLPRATQLGLPHARPDPSAFSP